jgi:peptidylprolyl isomerase
MDVMKRKIGIFALLTFFTISSLIAEESQASQPAETTAELAQPLEIGKISEAFGHVIGKNLENIGVKFDTAQVIKGLQDAIAGKKPPMSEMDCIQAIASAQEKIFKQQCAENLRRAEAFLSDNSKTEGIVAIEDGKVQYRITEEGEGAIIEAHYSPLLKYTGKHLDGSVFGTSKEEEMISLDEIIPGLKAGLLGMKEGEKRTVYIHPDLAYGTNGYLPPNSLLTFEVEIIKANAPIQEEATETEAQKPMEKHEIAELKTDIR